MSYEDISTMSFFSSSKRKVVVPHIQADNEYLPDSQQDYQITFLPNSHKSHVGVLIESDSHLEALASEEWMEDVKPLELEYGTMQIVGIPVNGWAETAYRIISGRGKKLKHPIIHEFRSNISDAFNEYRTLSHGSPHTDSVKYGIEHLFKTRHLEHVGLGLVKEGMTEQLQGEYIVQLFGGSYMNKVLLLEKYSHPKTRINRMFDLDKK